jgi:hypothetical protein
MPQHWDYNNPPENAQATSIGALANYVLGDKFNDVNTNLARVYNLYNYLLEHHGESAATLARQITQDGKPIFTEAEMKSILEVIHRQLGSDYGQEYVGMRGGGGAAASKAPVANAASTNKPPASPLEDDPSRNKFWDRIIRKMAHPITKRIPPSWNGVLWYAFILYSLEQLDVVGPFISSAMDAITLSLPIMAGIVQEGAINLFTLLPIPYAGLLGKILGYSFSMMFIVLAIFINLGRKHFGSAFKVSLEALPVIGTMATRAASQFETGAERYLQNRKKMLKSVGKVSPTAEAFGSYWTPSDEIHDEPMPSLNVPAIKKDIITYVAKSSGLNAIDLTPVPLPEQAAEGNAAAAPAEGNKQNAANANGNKVPPASASEEPAPNANGNKSAAAAAANQHKTKKGGYRRWLSKGHKARKTRRRN